MKELVQSNKLPSIIGIDYDKRLINGLEDILAKNIGDKKESKSNLKYGV